MKIKNRKQKVFVGMSGGVDSSVSAALLKKAGYDVTGVFIKVWQPDWLECTWKEDRRDAMRVAALLDVPFLTFNLEKEYKKEVVDYMIREYRSGRTPNPDVMCNKAIKFGSFFRKARKMGADFIATGHYARIKEQNGKHILLEGKDKNKDQSYFLYNLTQKELTHTFSPVGQFPKEKVRKLAGEFDLPNATKKDSQGLCFIGKVDMKEFLKNYIRPKKGIVLNEKKEIIGQHDGAHFFTIGQRHGFIISKKKAEDRPHYVVSKDLKNNTLIVSDQRTIKNELLGKNECEISNINWVDTEPDWKKSYICRIRYRQTKQKCRLNKINKNRIRVIFNKPQEGLSSGQSLVIYYGENCLGGGVIEV